MDKQAEQEKAINLGKAIAAVIVFTFGRKEGYGSGDGSAYTPAEAIKHVDEIARHYGIEAGRL